MALHFLYEVGKETVYGIERFNDGSEIFFARRLSDDKYETPIGGPIYGLSPKDLAEKVRLKIQEEVTDEDFSWETREVEVNPQNVLVKRMSHQEYDVDFLSAMSFAPKS